MIWSFSASKTAWTKAQGWTLTASAVFCFFFFFCGSGGRCSSSSSLLPVRQTPAGWGRWRWHHCVSLAHCQLTLRVRATPTATAAILFDNYYYDHIDRIVIKMQRSDEQLSLCVFITFQELFQQCHLIKSGLKYYYYFLSINKVIICVWASMKRQAVFYCIIFLSNTSSL